MADTKQLADFFRARLDEDEANARDALTRWPGPHFTPDPGSLAILGFHRRVLREVEAGRAIIAEHEAVTKLAVLTGQDLGFLGWYREWVLKHLAAVYSDHPDYRQEWRLDL